MADNVTVSLATYNKLRDANTELVLENKELRDAIEALQEADGQKVIIRECEQWEDEDGEEYEHHTTRIKGFDEVKQEVEEFYKKKLADLEAKIKELDDEKMVVIKERKKYYEQKLEAEMEVSRLKHRNLWQRILNK